MPLPSSSATGNDDGAIVKCSVGARVGNADGFLTVITVDTADGAAVDGFLVGATVGTAVLLESSSVLPLPSSYATGNDEGAIVKCTVDGDKLGAKVGRKVVVVDGETLSARVVPNVVGAADGETLGAWVGLNVGAADVVVLLE